MKIEFVQADLTSTEQSVVSRGFDAHSQECGAPPYAKERVKWLLFADGDELTAALTADILWDWIYIDELWVCTEQRGNGVGRKLMHAAEALAAARQLRGLWLWTQDWQAEGFYKALGYREFARFDDFPRGYARIGFRKSIA